MKFLLFVLACVGTAVCSPEAPAAPYAPSGWRPQGPAFELPTRNSEAEAPDTYRSPKEEQTVEITEEEIQYSGDLGTTESPSTPFSEYGPPQGSDDAEATTPLSEADEGLTVQGLPGTEAAKEFRALPARLRAPPKQKTARLQAPRQNLQFQRQQIASFTGFQAPNQFGLGIVQTGQRNGKTFGQSVSQFGRLTARPVAVIQPAFFQRQEVAADPIAVPAQAYGPANEYGPPIQAFGPPTQVPELEGDIDLEEQSETEPELPQQEEEEEDTTEPSDAPEGAGEENVVAISNSFAERYTQRRQGKSAKLRSSGASAKLRVANLRPLNEPIYTFNQFGQLVRIY